jgi:hypothetical protein
MVREYGQSLQTQLAVKDEMKKLIEIEKKQDKDYLLKQAELHELEKQRQREVEE